MTTVQATTVTTAAPAAFASEAMKLFGDMRAKTKAGGALSTEETNKLIKGMTDLNVSNGDIDWLMGKVFKAGGTPATQNLFTQKLQERGTMAQTISSVWRAIFETMQAIARNIR